MNPQIQAIKMMHPDAHVCMGKYIVTQKETEAKDEVTMIVGVGIDFGNLKPSSEFEVVLGTLVFIPYKTLGIHKKSPEDFLARGMVT